MFSFDFEISFCCFFPLLGCKMGLGRVGSVGYSAGLGLHSP